MLRELSRELSEVAERRGPSVVQVDAGHRRGASGVVWSADGLIVTADHKVVREEKIEIGLADGVALRATLVGRDPTTDLAVLRAEASGLQTLEWTPVAEVKVAQLTLALARPGKTVRASLGVISAFSRESWRAPGGGKLSAYLETDIGGRAGFSGGVLFAADGRAIGVNTGGLLRGTSLTIPENDVRRVVQAILSHGGVRRGFLGVALQPVRLPPAQQEKAGQEIGLILLSIQADGPADRAGLMIGDVLLSLDGTSVRDLGELHNALDEEKIGKESTLRILRGGAVEERKITVGAR